MVATMPVDFRKGAEGLATLVREAMMADPLSGTVWPGAKANRGSDRSSESEVRRILRRHSRHLEGRALLTFPGFTESCCRPLMLRGPAPED
jgi:hypothetical protein